MGGLEINAESCALSTPQHPIPGLFAAGEIDGSMHGANRLGGSSLLVFEWVNEDSGGVFALGNEQGCQQDGRASRRCRGAHYI